jgi:4-hydroxy-4-methyl-2-oxoglutarate aldolase
MDEERRMPSVLERFSTLPTAALSDGLRGQHTLDPAIQCMTPGVGLAGPAYTVLAEAGSIITVHKALLEAPAGSVIVVGGETSRILYGALMGKLMGLQAKLLGIAGMVIDGAIRDVSDLREMGFPVFARAATPRVGTNRTVGQTQVPTPCGGIIVYPGDFVRGDDDGVMVVPANRLDQAVEAAEARLAKEAEFERQMHAGAHVTDLVGLSEILRGAQA